MGDSSCTDWVSAVGAFGSLLSAIAVVFSLVFLGRQVSHLRRTLEITSYHQVQNLMIDIDQFFINDITLWKYFRENCEPSTADEDGPNGDKLKLVAELLLDHFDNVFHQRDLLPKETYDGFVSFMREIYSSSPVFREFINKRKAENQPWYNSQFLRIFGEQ